MKSTNTTVGRIKTGRILTQLLTFAVMGGVATSAHYAVLALLVEYFNVAPVPASAVGYTIGMLTNYTLNYRFTFRSSKRHNEAFAKFALVAMMGLLLNSIIMSIGVRFLDLHYLLSQVISTGLTLIWNFAANRIWTFRGDDHVER